LIKFRSLRSELALGSTGGILFGMGLPHAASRLSEAEYLEIERAAEFKSEFFDGEIFAMAAGTRAHSLIAANLIGEMRAAFKGGPCVVFDSNLRVKVEASGLVTYPDVIVACEPQRFLDEYHDTLLNPTLLVEVLSEPTEGYDRGKKSEHYRQISSLREYILVSQHEPRLEQFIREPNGDWRLRDVSGLGKELRLASASASIPLSEIFARVQFAPGPLRPVSPPRE
jgi:Uma2 family endonuclease